MTSASGLVPAMLALCVLVLLCCIRVSMLAFFTPVPTNMLEALPSTPEELLTQHDLVGHDAQYAGQKTFMHYFHVCALMLTSEVHDRTGERTLTCLALG